MVVAYSRVSVNASPQLISYGKGTGSTRAIFAHSTQTVNKIGSRSYMVQNDLPSDSAGKEGQCTILVQPNDVMDFLFLGRTGSGVISRSNPTSDARQRSAELEFIMFLSGNHRSAVHSGNDHTDDLFRQCSAPECLHKPKSSGPIIVHRSCRLNVFFPRYPYQGYAVTGRSTGAFKEAPSCASPGGTPQASYLSARSASRSRKSRYLSAE